MRSISPVMRRIPKACWIWAAVISCTSAPVTKIMPVHPSTISPIVSARKPGVAIGRTSP